MSCTFSDSLQNIKIPWLINTCIEHETEVRSSVGDGDLIKGCST